VGELVESATRHRDAVEVRRKLEEAQDMQQQLVRQCVEQKTYIVPFFMRHLRGHAHLSTCQQPDVQASSSKRIRRQCTNRVSDFAFSGSFLFLP
jgi:hypothetical protein